MSITSLSRSQNQLNIKNKTKLANIENVSNNIILGRTTAGSGKVEQLTPTQLRTLINVADGANNYIHPAKHTVAEITETVDKFFMTKTDRDQLTNVVQIVESGIADTNHTHSLDKITETATKVIMTSTERTKLAGIADNANNYVHPTTAGNKHIPTGGAAGQVLVYSSSGTASWQTKTTGGTSNFVGNGSEVTIPHGLGVAPTSATVFPTANPGGYLGEVWVRWDSTNVYVGNTGDFTGGLTWMALR